MQDQARALRDEPPGEAIFQAGRVQWETPLLAINRPSPRFEADAQVPLTEHPDRFIERILVPTDFSPRSVKAVECAAALAHQCDARLTLLHVIDVGQSVVGEASPAAEFMRRLWEQGLGQMARLVSSLTGQFNVQTVVEEGLPWEQIVERSRQFDLVILGGNRAKPARKFFSRHTARRVVENAACPVLVVRERDSF